MPLHTELAILRRAVVACADGSLPERLHYLWRAWRAVRVITPSGTFDAAWYARDGTVSGSPKRLIWHYVLRGAQEGRSPSPAFDTAHYLRAHPQVGLAGLNPLAHYVTEGREQGLQVSRAPRAALPRQALSEESYPGWIGERARLDAPILARLRSATLPPVDVAGGPDTGAPFILLLPAGVTCAPGALVWLSAAVSASPGMDLFYADEDRISPEGTRAAPWFKPDWDPELSRVADLLGPAALVRRSLLAEMGWDGRVPSSTAQRGLTAHAAGAGCRIGHIPRVLFHRPVSPILAALARAPRKPSPLVTIIIPTRDRARLLRKAAEGVLRQTDYAPIELLIVDNGSTQRATRRLLAELAVDPRVKILLAPGSFNWSAMNNQAARAASGDVLMLLNNDVEITSPGWLAAMVDHAMRQDVGAVGARLLYPDGTLQHAGLGIDSAGCFCHPMRGAPADAPGVFGELRVPRSVAAVTGACLAIRRDIFFEVGGLEQDALAVTCNDIDLCLRVRRAGYRVVYAPEAVLVHREAASRGHDAGAAQLARVQGERDYLRRQWGELATRDPYLNANLCLLNGMPALEAPALV